MPGRKKRRALTKQQKFDLEMVYKPIFEKATGSKAFKDDYIGNLRVFCLNIHKMFKDDKDSLFDFLIDFEDNIAWYEMLNNTALVYTPYFMELVDIFSDHFTPRCWVFISDLNDVLSNNNFLERYKDNLDWGKISKYKNFSLDDLKRFKNNIDFCTFFKHNLHSTKYEILEHFKNSLED